GNPYGGTLTVSAGVLAATEREGRVRVGAWVHDGHKGGALLDSTGRLIGVPAADIFEGQERKQGESYLGVAVPIDRAREALAAELAGEVRAPGLTKAPVASEAELALRRDKVTQVVAKTRDSLLNIEVYVEKPKAGGFDPFATEGELRMLGQGSGAVIDDSGLAITNWHVVQDTLAADGTQRADHKVQVTMPNGKRYGARVLATSRDDDLALIQLELPEGESVVPVPLGASKTLRRGDVVIAIGNPYGKANTVTVGIVAAKDQDANISGRLHVYENMLQTDAAINPGNSGGAMLDPQGQLVGINSAGRSGAGLAIPVERVREVFGEKLLATMGAFVGFAISENPEGGTVVTLVDENGPAARAGLLKGDRLLAVDMKPVMSPVDLGNLLLGRGLEPMRVDVVRGELTQSMLLQPMHHDVWRLLRQTGIELSEVDYASESALVREASIALHRAYTGLAESVPTQLMSSALRVVTVKPRDGVSYDVRPGDLLLGATWTDRTIDTELVRLARFESLRTLRDFTDARATKTGEPAELWILRDGKVHSTNVPLFKVR
ncbi:MAG: trypsin-like peptidase domain-containing protein, partial [Planctomycetota bacterium]|nr:trypsin-like peptidase domain-containing protein [Planctomycetota bacterium]